MSKLRLTQKQRFNLEVGRSQVISEYLLFCIELNQVPNGLITSLLTEALSTEALENFRKDLEKRLKEYRENK